MRFLLPALVVAIIGGCGRLDPYAIGGQRGRNYFAALDAVRATAPHVGDFTRLFPDTKVSYIYFAPGPGPGFNCDALLYERYELVMQLPVTFDWSGTKATGYGEPKFYLHEVREVDLKDRHIKYDGSGQRHFGLAEWKKIVEANGDFKAIDYEMKKDKPVPDLKKLRSE